jgi:hypothetical protein
MKRHLLTLCLALAIGLVTNPNASAQNPVNTDRDVIQSKRSITRPLGRDLSPSNSEPIKQLPGGEQRPILLLYERPGLTLEPKYELYFALWRDGTILWYRSEGKNLEGSYREARHYRARISEKQVEEFLAAFAKSDLYQYAGKGTGQMVDGPTSFFLLETEEGLFRFTMGLRGNIHWADGGSVRPLSAEEQKMADAWKVVLGMLRDLCISDAEMGKRAGLVEIETKPGTNEWLIKQPIRVDPPRNR